MSFSGYNTLPYPDRLYAPVSLVRFSSHDELSFWAQRLTSSSPIKKFCRTTGQLIVDNVSVVYCPNFTWKYLLSTCVPTTCKVGVYPLFSIVRESGSILSCTLCGFGTINQVGALCLNCSCGYWVSDRNEHIRPVHSEHSLGIARIYRTDPQLAADIRKCWRGS